MIDNKIKKTIEMFVDCLNENGLHAFEYLVELLSDEDNKEAAIWIDEYKIEDGNE